MDNNKDKQSTYAPIRLRSRFWWRYALLAAKDGHITRNGMISTDLPSMIEQSLIAPYITSFAEQVRDAPNSGQLIGVHAAKMDQLRHWVPLVGQYELCGRQIFDLHDELVDMLRETDLGDCSLEDWNAPYDAFYVRFGKQDSIKLPFEGAEYEYLDGAFVAFTPYDAHTFRLKFGFTMVKSDGQGVGLPGYFIDVLPSEQRLPVPEAIESALTRRLSELDNQEMDTNIDRIFNDYRRTEVQESADVLRAGASLLVNALFYLENLGSVLPVPEPGRDTPPERVTRWMKTPITKQHKQKSALTADGYAIVRLVGREVASERQSIGHSIKAHWRRGHWRFQRHGEGLVLRKRIWIKPALVGVPPDEGAMLQGHIYVTDKPSGTTH